MSALTGFVAAGALAFTPIHVDGLFIDGFAGGGGASTGIEQAIGRDIDIAVNHSPTAIAIHKANHPGTTHYCQDIKALWPLAATKMQPVAGAWFSPDCKEYSRAKGGPVKDRSIRALCWEVIHWLDEVRPTCGYLENVEEFQYAAPLDENREPIKGQEGREFKRFVAAIRKLGYRVKWWVLKACDYGAPTSRKRLYMVMRNDGLPIVKPKPTHGAPGSAGVRSGRLLPYRTAAECIDWSIECPSIFTRKRELADATKRRIAHGVMRYVVNAAKPFIVRDGKTFVPHINTNRNAQKPYTAANEPTHTITSGGAHQNVVQASLVTYGQHGGKSRPVDVPHHTIAASNKDTNGVVTAFLSSFYGSDKRGSGGDPEQPLRTVRANGLHHAVVETTLFDADALPLDQMERAVKVAAFLVKYYATNGENEASQIQPVDRPLDTITTKHRFAVVTVTIDAKTYVIVDIGLRMLTPRELANAQGFPAGYVLNPIVRKFLRGKWVERRLTLAEQINAIGNSVSPPMARALVLANQPSSGEPMRLAA